MSAQRPREVVHSAGVARTGSFRWISAALVLSGAVSFAASCLNPRPDDMPSALGEDDLQPGNPEPTAPTGVNPGIGGDNLVEDPDDDEGGLPITPGMMSPEDPEGPSVVGSPDAGAGPGINPFEPDAGADGG